MEVLAKAGCDHHRSQGSSHAAKLHQSQGTEGSDTYKHMMPSAYLLAMIGTDPVLKAEWSGIVIIVVRSRRRNGEGREGKPTSPVRLNVPLASTEYGVLSTYSTTML